MTLIHLPGSAYRDNIRKWKNEFWESRQQTPNEAYDTDADYRRMIHQFAKWNGISGPFKFKEVRIVSKETSVIYSGGKKWWDHRRFMDHCFWMFHSPIVETIDGVPYSYYALEPFECQRVWRILIADLGQSIPDKQVFRSGLAVPCECAIHAWTETANGYSEHIHHRPDAVITQEQIDRDARIKAGVDTILERAMDLREAKLDAIDPEEVKRLAKDDR